jgi:hypothetical protein
MSSPVVLKLVPRDVGVGESTFIQYDTFNNEYTCKHGIKCPNVGAIQIIINGHVTNNNGLVYDDQLRKYAFGYWFWKNKRINTGRAPPPAVDRAVSFVRVYEEYFQHSAIGSFLKARYYCNWIQGDTDMSVIVVNKVQMDIVQYACTIDKARYIIFERATHEVYVKTLFVIHWLTTEKAKQGQLLTLAASPPNVITLPHVPTAKTVFYMQRKQNLGTRYVTNDIAVIRTIRAFAINNNYTFSVFNGDTTTLINATHIIGPHGGAFGNIIYGNNNTKVLEFITLKGLRERPCYILSAGTMGLKYDHVEPVKGFNFLKGGMTIDTERLKQHLYNL